MSAIFRSLASVFGAFASGTGTSLVGDVEDGAGALPRNVHSILRERVRPFGRMTTSEIDDVLSGARAVDVRAKVQAAFDYALTLPRGCVIEIAGGDYYLGAGYADFAQLSIGRYNGAGPKNIDVEAYGAVFYQGNVGKALAINKSSRCSVRGLKIIGYAGGALGATRENDACLTINYNSANVLIEDAYLTNSLGDCIYAGGSLVAGGELGFETRNLRVIKSVLKSRVGDGVPSFTGGTMSRHALAVIDAVGVHAHGNTIYGGVDLEPNLNSQNLVDVHIDENHFRSGNVTAQAVVGTDYWLDEPINLTGGSVISQYITMVGTPGVPTVSGCTADENTFDDGVIYTYNVYAFDSVANNKGKKLLIRVGATSGANNTSNVTVKNNVAQAYHGAETTLVKLEGMLSFCEISDNHVNSNVAGYCVDDNGVSTGDGGRNIFKGNAVTGSVVHLGALGFTPLKTSFVTDNKSNDQSAYVFAKSQSVAIEDIHTPMKTLALSGAGLVIDWRAYGGNMWFLNCGAVNTTITQIQNTPGEGFELTIFSGSSAGATLTLTQNTSYFRLKGAVNAVLPDVNATITLISRAGIWFEKCRNF